MDGNRIQRVDRAQPGPVYCDVTIGTIFTQAQSAAQLSKWQSAAITLQYYRYTTG